MVKKERIPRPPKHTKRENNSNFSKGKILQQVKRSFLKWSNQRVTIGNNMYML